MRMRDLDRELEPGGERPVFQPSCSVDVWQQQVLTDLVEALGSAAQAQE